MELPFDLAIPLLGLYLKNPETPIQKSIWNYYEQLYATKFENLGEMGKFPENYNIPEMNAQGGENLNRQ